MPSGTRRKRAWVLLVVCVHIAPLNGRYYDIDNVGGDGHAAILTGDQLAFPDLNVSFGVHLAKHQAVFLPGDEDASVPRHEDGMPVQQLWLSGFIEGEEAATVHLTVSEGDMYGTVIRANGSVLNVLPGVSNAFRPRLSRRATLARRTAAASTTTVSNGAAGPTVTVNDAGTDLARAGARCTMFLDADSTFHARWGGEGSEAVRKRRTAAKMISIVHGANSVISDPINFGASFGIIVAGTDVHTDPGWLDHVGNDTEGVSGYEAYLGTTLADARPRKGRAIRHRRTIPANDVCLNFLFIHRALGDRLGIAILGSIVPGAITGACARQPSVTGGQVLVSNAGMITTLHNHTTVSVSSSLHTFVHEFGHSFGAIHTCCHADNPDCEAGVPCDSNATEATVCHPVGRKYLMNPSYLSTNMLMFSQCNKAIIRRSIQHHADCLAVSPCQMPGACCRAGRLLSRGTICRAPNVDHGCSGLAFCNGVTSECPLNSNRPDGSICQLAGGPGLVPDGVCTGGSCVSTSQDYCLARGLVGCTLSGQPYASPCVPACSMEVGGNCKVHLDAVMPAGRPCRTESATGVCTAAGACHTSGLPAPQQGVYPTPSCRWTPGDWAPCSTECDGGVRNRSYECSCDDGSKDESGVWCTEPRPNPVAEACGERACTSCSTISVVAEGPTAHSWTFHRRPNGDDELGACDGCFHYRCEAEQLYLYRTLHSGRYWWVIGELYGTRYAWRYYSRATSKLPALTAGPWSQLVDRVAVPVANITLACRCSAPSQLAPDGAGCDAPGAGSTRSAATAAPGTSFAVPFSTSTPHPELDPGAV